MFLNDIKYSCFCMWWGAYWVYRVSGSKAGKSLPTGKTPYDTYPHWLRFHIGINRYELYSRHDPTSHALLEDLATRRIVSSGTQCQILILHPLISLLSSSFPSGFPTPPLQSPLSLLLGLAHGQLHNCDRRVVGGEGKREEGCSHMDFIFSCFCFSANQ